MGGRTLDVGGARSVTRYGGTARSVRRLVHPLAVERGTACSSAAAATGCPAATAATTTPITSTTSEAAQQAELRREPRSNPTLLAAHPWDPDLLVALEVRIRIEGQPQASNRRGEEQGIQTGQHSQRDALAVFRDFLQPQEFEYLWDGTSSEDLDWVAQELNDDRPRKRLGFKKPIEQIGDLRCDDCLNPPPSDRDHIPQLARVRGVAQL